MIIHIVTASSGQYDDYYKWNVKAFPTRALAQEFIDSLPVIDHTAIGELQQLQYEYSLTLVDDDTNYSEWTEGIWEKAQEAIDELYNKAIAEVQAKYPDADLTVDEDFYGYAIEELEMIV